MGTDGSVYEVGTRQKARVYKNRGESANKFSKQITVFMLGRNNKILLFFPEKTIPEYLFFFKNTYV